VLSHSLSVRELEIDLLITSRYIIDVLKSFYRLDIIVNAIVLEVHLWTLKKLGDQFTSLPDYCLAQKPVCFSALLQSKVECLTPFVPTFLFLRNVLIIVVSVMPLFPLCLIQFRSIAWTCNLAAYRIVKKLISSSILVLGRLPKFLRLIKFRD
jgi:hypothetical protein